MTTTNQTITSNEQQAIDHEMPVSVPDEMHDEFHALIAHLKQRDGIVAVEDIPLVEQLLHHRFAMREATKHIVEHGVMSEDGERNPAAAILASHSAAALKLADALNMGPKARRIQAQSATTTNPVRKGIPIWEAAVAGVLK